MIRTKLVKLKADNPDKDEISKAVKLIDTGKLVAFPTETVYGIACRVQTDFLKALDSLKGRGPEKYYTLHISDKTEVPKYVPKIGLRVKKLLEKAWPGPLTMVFELSDKDLEKLHNSIDKQVFENLYRNNSIGIRCPDNAIAKLLLEQSENPIVAPSANKTGQPPAVDAKTVFAQFSGQIDLILDGGVCKYKKSSTVAKIGKKGIEILRAGFYTQDQMKEWSIVRTLFVCTGNTCRSPMAEGILKKLLAEKSECNIDQLSRIGYKISSAGTMGFSGVPASAEAVTVCATNGIDIKAHRNAALSRELVEKSDIIFVMNRGHRLQVVVLDRTADKRCYLLAADRDVPDPIGQSQEVYNRCFEQIEKAVKKTNGRVSNMKIAVGSDHRGFESKEQVKAIISQLGHEVIDFGAADNNPVDYPDMAYLASKAVSEGRVDRAILACGTGIGMSIAANKINGIRAALCHDELSAQISRDHNDANILCVSGDLIGEVLLRKIVEVWLRTDFSGGRHKRRVNKITAIEQGKDPKQVRNSKKTQ